MCTQLAETNAKSPRQAFQFPSNGKAHVHWSCLWGRWWIRFCVSIPFKRESTCALKGVFNVQRKTFKFQFPSNGKAHVHVLAVPTNNILSTEFQFPSNGKAHVHDVSDKVNNNPDEFQFPSNGKAHVHVVRLDDWEELVEFQFPSNGKAHVHAIIAGVIYGPYICFNSLQTGKHICTSRGRSHRAL